MCEPIRPAPPVTRTTDPFRLLLMIDPRDLVWRISWRAAITRSCCWSVISGNRGRVKQSLATRSAIGKSPGRCSRSA